MNENKEGRGEENGGGEEEELQEVKRRSRRVKQLDLAVTDLH